ncbi:hypothetical protein ASPCAL12153 [Aspergillus calidoustus]|uniref:FAD-binding domain-containing protein n=1 Tax=Aspergillus calidoustus TaxID=454130 RepID=A0A0U5GA78_ASPCI|nr:hypothetical protein ASPCAL12153 [Aspergillus calidoustus]
MAPVDPLAPISLSTHGIPHTLSSGTREPKRTAWYTDLGPSRREIHTREWGGGRHAVEYEGISPCHCTILPQTCLEPILLERARELNPGGIVHNADVIAVVETPSETDPVTVTLDHADINKRKAYSASYVSAVDAGRTVGPKLGIESRGRPIFSIGSLRIFTRRVCESGILIRVLIIWFIDPARGGSIRTGYLYHLGPYNTSSERGGEGEGKGDGDSLGDGLMFACARSTTDPRKSNEADMLARLSETLNIPAGKLDGEIEFLSASHWIVKGIVANRFRSKGGRDRTNRILYTRPLMPSLHP